MRFLLDWAWNHLLIVVLDFILTFLLAYPLWHYMRYGWNRKWEEFEDTLTPSGKRIYMVSFRRLPYEALGDDEIDNKFKKLYREAYGLRWFLIPIVFVLVIAAVSNFAIASDLIRLASAALGVAADARASVGDAKFYIAPASLAGAYMFVAYDFFLRVQKRNMLPVDITRGAFRLAIAIPMGYAFATLNLAIGPFIAFAIGAFPLGDLLTLLRQVGNERLKLKIGPAPVGSRVIQLLGVDPDTADRLEDADITTIQQLSTCDPVDLAARTNLHFRYVANMCSQASAWIYLAEKGEDGEKREDYGRRLNALRPLGLAGALEIRGLMSELTSRVATTRRKAERVLAAAASAAKLPVEGLRHSFEQIDAAFLTKFLFEALSQAPTAPAAAPGAAAPAAAGRARRAAPARRRRRAAARRRGRG